MARRPPKPLPAGESWQRRRRGANPRAGRRLGGESHHVSREGLGQRCPESRGAWRVPRAGSLDSLRRGPTWHTRPPALGRHRDGHRLGRQAARWRAGCLRASAPHGRSSPRAIPRFADEISQAPRRQHSHGRPGRLSARVEL